jgi:hypothetical protein
MIITVPHSGSRTLSEHLGEPFFHFHHDVEFSDVIDVPVRDPLSHVISWVCFEGATDHARGFYAQCERLIFLDHPHRIHKIESLPVLDGVGPCQSHPLRAMLKEHDIDGLRKELPDFFEWLGQAEIRAFYEQFYDLWYLREEA